MLTLKFIISILALALLGAHMLWPAAQIDVISFGLLIVALLPWASSLVESAKFPGGWEINFRDLKAASAAIDSATPPPELGDPASSGKQEWSEAFRPIAESDPNLALVALRIEIEKRLRVIARQNSVSDNLPLTRLFRELRQKEVLTHEIFEPLEEIVQAGNRAAHGASVEPSVQRWAVDSGSKIIAALDFQIRPETTF